MRLFRRKEPAIGVAEFIAPYPVINNFPLDHSGLFYFPYEYIKYKVIVMHRFALGYHIEFKLLEEELLY